MVKTKVSAANNENIESQKTQILKKLDDAEFSWFHVKAVLVSGVGFFTVRLKFYRSSSIKFPRVLN